ncbi:MAG: hypothetical protein K6G26_06585 [Lachnospiraceae bacterium]|nr:hypothetical protein [Lachnospiraceae bacterium]
MGLVKINKKAVIGLSLCALVASGAAYGIKSKAAYNKSASEEVYATGLCEASEEERAWFEENAVIIDSAEDYYDLMEDGELTEVYNDEDAKEKEEKDAEYDTTLSSSVDNSKSKYFPEIKNQGTVGSCCSFAMAYYQFTYTYNKYNDIESVGDNNIYSPMWAYTVESSTFGVPKTLMERGAATVEEVPIIDDVRIFNNGTAKVKNYYLNEELSKKSSNRRISGIFEIPDITGNQVTSPDCEALKPIKTVLDNGDLLTFSTHVYCYNWSDYTIEYNSGDSIYDGTSNKKYKGDMIVARCDKNRKGDHRMTIVGYDDNIWVDINKNGKKEIGEMGAFKIANSWGTNWGNKGFMWVSYDAMNYESSVRDNAEIELKTSTCLPFAEMIGYYSKETYPKQYMEFDIEVTDETAIENSEIIADNGIDSYIFKMQSPFGAIYEDNYIGTVLYPLDNVISDIDSEKLLSYEWTLRMGTVFNDDSIKISNVRIIDEETGKVYRDTHNDILTVNSEYKDIKINMADEGNENAAIIYYSGYSNPNIHYCIDGREWTTVPGIAMTKTTEKPGYTHMAEIDLGDAEGVTVCFNDGNNNWDSNNGKNYRFGKGIYTYKNGSINKIGDITYSGGFNAVIDTEEYGCVKLGDTVNVNAKAYGAESDVSYRFGYVDNLNSNEVIISDYSSIDNASIIFNEVGTYNIFADVKDNSGNYIRKYIYNFTVEKPVVYLLVPDIFGPQAEGTTITFTVNHKYLNDNFVVEFVARGTKGNETVIEMDNNNQFKWTPYDADEYTTIARVRKGDTIYNEWVNSYTYKITSTTSNFKILTVMPSIRDAAINDSMYVSTSAMGGVWPYQFEVGYKNNGVENILASSSATTNLVIVPEVLGNVTFYVRVTDSEGKVAYKEFTVAVHKFAIDNLAITPEGKVYAGETVTFDITTEYERNNGTANVRYFTVTNKKTGEVERFNSDSDSVTWTPAKAGTYTIECNITSYQSGSDTYTFDYTVYRNNEDELYIDSIIPSIDSPAKAGDSIYFDINRVNEIVDDSNYAVYHITNLDTNETADYTENVYTDSSRFIWTPEKAGNYSINVEFFANGTSTDETINYVVEETPAKNLVTIYYKGFSTPYIHYQVAGSWTNVPGLAMTPDTSISGFTHKAVIELPEGESSLTACFNDGNNHWDSNNGKNYTFTLGEYTYSNGIIKRIGEISNTTTIYYSGYSTPYIHYSINGVWTNVPGIAMEATNEESGYTHKAVIDMSDADTLIACFNDGGSNWDSRNGQNYTFGVGTYYYKNGQITAK